MMNKEQRESWTRLVDVSTSRRWFDGVILAADAACIRVGFESEFHTEGGAA